MATTLFKSSSAIERQQSIENRRCSMIVTSSLHYLHIPPRPVLQILFAVRSRPLALQQPASTGGNYMAVPSEDYSRQPPCCAGFFGEGREAENAQSKKKDYENKNN